MTETIEETTWKSRPPAVIVYILGLLGGVVAIPVAIVTELQHIDLSIVVVAGFVEEICKPIAVILILDKRPHWFRNFGGIVVVACLAALVFATLENLMYLALYKGNNYQMFVFWRLVICTSMHISATCIFSLGLAKCWRRAMETGKRFSLKGSYPYYFAAAGLHGAYNVTVGILTWLNVLEL